MKNTVKSKPKHQGSVPYGFCLDEDRMLVSDPDEQRVIAAARELRLSGISYDQIALQLGLRGFTSRGGWPFVRMQVSRMMTDRS